MMTKITERQATYHILTFGCQMNKNDSERLSSVLEHMGLEWVATPEEADVIMLNSCSVRESAEHRIFGHVAKLAALKVKNPDLIIGVTGCMPGRDRHGELRKKLPEADLFFPIKDMVHLPQWLSEFNPALRPMDDLPADYLSLRPAYRAAFQSFVTIQTGCNHFCTYCVVPYSRGLEVNRRAADILAEVRSLAGAGCVEVTLLGQIVNHYIAPDSASFSPANAYRKNDFAKLLWEINQVPGIERIHWTAPHPLYMDAEAIDALSLPKQVNYIHLPVQAGNNEVLARMNRRHTREYYLETIQKIRARRPGIAIGTDIIVGFCGETPEQFEDTVRLYQECDFDISYHAQYSTRSGTLATKIYTDDVPKAEKKRRWQVLQDIMEDATHRKNQLFVSQTVSVLFDDFDRGFLTGNSREMKRVRVKGDAGLVGAIRDVSVFRADTWMLWGRLD